ncbi:MAG: PDZ domain-containing protein [Myxococcota bacterium]
MARPAGARPPRARKAVRYEVAIPSPTSQYVHVTMAVDDPRGGTSDIAMPAWAPGSYRIRDFARHVYDVQAHGRDGRALVVSRPDKQTWRVHHGGNAFEVAYRVFAADVGVRTSHIDDQHASLIGTSIFMYVARELSRAAVVKVAPPKGWEVHVALPTQPTDAGRVLVRASDYDALVDAPLELGTPTVERFSVDGSEFEYVLTGAETLAADPKRLARDAKRIVEAYAELMQGLPMQRYLFLAEATASGGGGLEHANSTSMILRRGMFAGKEGYARAARLAAHEFFHAWNVKRIHDVALGPFDYARENHSRLLWFHEGFTETMEALALLRAGLVEPAEYLQRLGRSYTRYRALPGRNHDPLSQLSFEAWTKGYQPADNHRNMAVSYYTKGDIVGVALDLELRLRSGGTGSLPGLFVRLMASHGARGLGITAKDIVAAATAEAGAPMAWFFERYVDGRDEVELAPLLRKIGVAVTDKPTGGTYSGLLLKGDGTVRDIETGSPAQAAGLMRGDRVIAIDGRRADARATAERRIDDAGAGATVPVTVFRGDRLVHKSIALVENPGRTWTLSLAPEVDAATVALRDAWLRSAEVSPADTPAPEATATSD